MEDYGRYNYEQENNQNMNGEARMNDQLVSRRKPEKKNKGKWTKRIGAVALSAVLFGGIAGGTFVVWFMRQEMGSSFLPLKTARRAR